MRERRDGTEGREEEKGLGVEDREGGGEREELHDLCQQLLVMVNLTHFK